MRQLFRRIIKILYGIVWRVALISASTLVILICLEIAVRIFLPQQLIILRPDIWKPTDNGRSFTHQSDIDTTINTGERDVRLLTDENGYRIGESTASLDPDIRILALGDSFLAALQVEYEDTMTALLENELSIELGQTVQVANTGVNGYSPNHYRIIARQELAQSDYDMVIAFVYVGNDFVNNNEETLSPRQPVPERPLRIPNNFSQSELIDAIFYPVNDWLERNSHLFIFVKSRIDVLLARLGLTAYYVTNAIQTDFVDAPHWANTVEILSDIQNEASQYNIPFIVVFIPTSYQVDEASFAWYETAFNIPPDSVDIDQPSIRFAETLGGYNLTVYDMLLPLRDAHQQDTTDLFGSVDRHLGINGHRVVADYLSPRILDLLQNQEQ